MLFWNPCIYCHNLWSRNLDHLKSNWILDNKLNTTAILIWQEIKPLILTKNEKYKNKLQLDECWETTQCRKKIISGLIRGPMTIGCMVILCSVVSLFNCKPDCWSLSSSSSCYFIEIVNKQVACLGAWSTKRLCNTKRSIAAYIFRLAETWLASLLGQTR